MLQWLLRNSLPAMLVAVPVLFAPELRRALEQLGRAGQLIPGTRAVAPRDTGRRRRVDGRAAAGGAALGSADRDRARHGAGRVRGERHRHRRASSRVDLLLSIFYPNSPLHDGAVIVRGDRVVAAGVVLPLRRGISGAHGHAPPSRDRHHRALERDRRGRSRRRRAPSPSPTPGRMVRNLGDGRLTEGAGHPEPLDAARWRSGPLVAPLGQRRSTAARPTPPDAAAPRASTWAIGAGAWAGGVILYFFALNETNPETT